MFPWFSKSSHKDRAIQPARTAKLKELCRKLSIQIRDYEKLDEALTHSSYVDKTCGCEDYERLEFLGDSILNASIAYLLYTNNPNLTEGGLSALRSSLVDEKTLAEISMRYDLLSYLNLGKGESLADARAREKVAADIIESIIGVLFLDAGFSKAMAFVKLLLSTEIKQRLKTGTRDFKTQLQKWAISKYKEYPVYQVVQEQGPDHNKIFEVQVTVHGEHKATAKGRTKKEAEQKSAEIVLQEIKNKKTGVHP